MRRTHADHTPDGLRDRLATMERKIADLERVRNPPPSYVEQGNSASFNYGDDVIPAGSSSVLVAHGVGAIPYTVLVTPRAGELLWVSDRNASTFTAERAGTTGDLTFDWLTTGRVAPPSASIYDSFDRADSPTLLGATDTGETWSALSGTWGISGNAAYMAAPTGTYHTAVVESGVSDCSVEVTMSAITVTTGNYGLAFRVTDDSNWWRFIVDRNNNRAYLQKRVAGAVSTLVTLAAAVAAGDVLRVDLSGSDIECYRNGTLAYATTDAFNSGATKHGLNLGGSSSTPRFDDFSITA